MGFAARVGELAKTVLAQPGTRLPGERRLKLRAAAQAGGINVAPELLAELKRRAGQ